MNALSLFVVEIMISLAISLTIISLLTPVLREVLLDGCGTSRRANFWVTFTQLMLVVSPLLLVIYFIPTQQVYDIHLIDTIKNTLFRTLLGSFVALSMIGRLIWKSVANDLTQQAFDLEPEMDTELVKGE